VLEGAYRITGLIGEGGMGAVYAAVQLRLNKRVAVKVMARDLAANREALARFHREAEITSHLGHPHLVTVIDFGTAATGEPYLVMEYLDGTDLDHRIRQLGKLPLETAVHITKQVASALAAAHGQGVVHRDLKPANVFLVQVADEPDFVKILDFGVSKVKAARTQLTNASAVIGTPNYMSPEQATGMVDEIDHRTDQWALACIAWEMLSGRGPFAADDMSALFYQVIHLDPQPLSKRAPNLPPDVEPVLRRALSKDLARRYPSIKDFARALEAAARDRPVDVTPLPVMVAQMPQAQEQPTDEQLEEAIKSSLGRHFKPIYAIAAAGIVLIVVAAIFLLRGAASPPPPVAAPVRPTIVPLPTMPPPAPPPQIVQMQIPADVGAKPAEARPKSKKPRVGNSDDPFAASESAARRKPERAAAPDSQDPFQRKDDRRPAAPVRPKPKEELIKDL